MRSVSVRSKLAGLGAQEGPLPDPKRCPTHVSVSLQFPTKFLEGKVLGRHRLAAATEGSGSELPPNARSARAEPEPETGTVRTIPGTGTIGTVFQEPKPCLPLQTVPKHTGSPFPRETIGTETRNRSNCSNCN